MEIKFSSQSLEIILTKDEVSALLQHSAVSQRVPFPQGSTFKCEVVCRDGVLRNPEGWQISFADGTLLLEMSQTCLKSLLTSDQSLVFKKDLNQFEALNLNVKVC